MCVCGVQIYFEADGFCRLLNGFNLTYQLQTNVTTHSETMMFDQVPTWALTSLFVDSTAMFNMNDSYDSKLVLISLSTPRKLRPISTNLYVSLNTQEPSFVSV